MENKITAYRTLVLKYDTSKLPPEVASKIPELLRVQEEFRQWANQWLKNPKTPKPVENPLKYFAVEFLYALKWLVGVKKSGVEVRRARPPLVFNAQLRLDGERDISYGVFVDLPKRQVRIRKWSGQRGNTIVLPLNEKAVEWMLERVKEGGRLKLAAVWVGKSRRNHSVKLYVALTFCREVVPIKFKRLLVVDLNALHNGLAWAVVEGEKMLKKGVLRPDISKILHLQKIASRLDKLCAKEDRACGEAVAVKSRIWRLLQAWEDDAVKELIWMARKRKAAIVVDVPDDKSIRELKEGNYVSERKVFLNFGRIRRRLKGLAEWYGIPYREERLYSTICPHCGAEMEEQPNRRVRCACGFETHRDEVPAFWAVKLYPKLVSFSGSPFSAAPPRCPVSGLRARQPTRGRGWGRARQPGPARAEGGGARGQPVSSSHPSMTSASSA
jgi:putative transposase